MSAVLTTNLENARFEPESEFDDPRQLIECAALTRGQKVAALHRWALLVQERLDATNEGMAPNGHSAEDLAILESINLALAAIGKAH